MFQTQGTIKAVIPPVHKARWVLVPISLSRAGSQGAGRVPSECPEAKRWAPSSWQKEKQLA